MPVQLTRPGVYVNQATFSTQVTSVPGNAVACFVGTHPRGPVVPTVINSWQQFANLYGGFSQAYPSSNLALAVYCYFSTINSGSCVVIRSVASGGGAPVTANLSLNDHGGTPQPTLKVSAANPGAWGNNIEVAISAGTVVVGGVPQTFNLVVYYGGNAAANIVETWTNLSMTPGSTNLGLGNYAPQVVNGNSAYITLTDLSSTNAAPLNNPATAAAASLTTGADGTAPTASDNQTALQQLDQYPDQNFLVNLPGLSDTTNLANALTYVAGRGDSFLVVDTAAGLAPSAAVSFEASLAQSPYQAVYYPWVIISDPYSTVRGAMRTVPPGGAVCAAIINTDTARGVAKAPAGLSAQIPIAQGLERVLTNTDQGTLNQANVNAIISNPQAGVVIWGARTTSNLLSNLYVNTQRSLSYIQANLISLVKGAVFENNDFVLWTSTSSIISQWLTSFWQSGGLAGQSPAQAFQVVCDGTINTPAVIEAGQFQVQVSVALQYPAEFVVITLMQDQSGAVTTVNSLTNIAA